MAEQSKLKIISLGGIDEIGKNITVFEYEDDIIVMDCGSIFPKEDMLGIDLVIPDISYLIANKERVRGYVFTHGHEDHIGATPYVLDKVPAPLHGSKLTLALIENKLREHRITRYETVPVEPRETVELGKFSVQFLRVNHSIAGACALAITCPAGTVLATGDFKIDFTPTDGQVTDLASLAAIGERGALALLADSTNVERPGYTMSERKVADTFNEQIASAPGRVIIAMFASNVNRVQQVADCAIGFGRKVCFIGRSMINVSTLAMELGYLVIPREHVLEIEDLDRYRDDQILVITTGSQGEPMSGLTRMAFAEHRRLQIKQSDKVIISATPIPGNEVSVSRVINQLYRSGAEVIYEALAEVHVSGHACQEEIKLMHALVKPKYFIPVHGEYRMLWQHAELAESMGMPRENIILPETGQVIEMNQNSLSISGVVPTGTVLIDGLGIGDVGNVVLRDRKHLSQEGLIIVAMAFDRTNGMLASGPDIISRGFVYVRENEDIIEGAREVVRKIIDSYEQIDGSDWPAIRNRIKDDLRRYFNDKIKRNPMILPVIVDLG
ncbi:MAG: ribonuclease J [Eubacteriales bacterium]|nr:ribonuclease J [Eubacteriales bacterium]MDD3109144.1 ribonuclease J [Eubacteriales bacterium]MDD3571722.1 ribonuclease J [Eubacteriales bacterium]MDD4134821.1 ribonuclease J [Eubacteriales bacterium]NLO14228.1 ribonuclease J [Clostridiales bacterium]